MARGMSIHIGLNDLDEKHYLRTGFRHLTSSVKDAVDMAEIAKTTFTGPVPFYNEPNKLFLDSDATTGNIKKILTEMAEGKDKLVSEDTLLITFSGHGSQLEDINNMESDGANETWCFYDRQFLDDEVFDLLAKFDKGVRIIVISDSCFSGTVIGSIEVDSAFFNAVMDVSQNFSFTNFEGKVLKVKKYDPVEYDEEIWQEDKKVLETIGFDSSDNNLSKLEVSQIKTIPQSVRDQINNDENNAKLYRKIQEDLFKEQLTRVQLEGKKDIRELIKASVILLSACQDWQGTRPGKTKEHNSRFTEVFKEVYAKGDFKNYLELHQRLWEFFDQNAKERSEIQNPNYYRIGTPNAEFEMQPPFTVQNPEP